MMSTIVLIGGKKRSGKDAFSKFFKKDGYVHIAFANKLKVELYTILHEVFKVNNTKIHLWDDLKETSLGLTTADGVELTNRRAMTNYGQAMKSLFGNEYWANRVANDIGTLYKGENIVISDLRFPYELDVIKSAFKSYCNVYSILIKRDTGIEDNDISETSLDSIDFDVTIDNNSDLDKLYQNYLKVINAINHSV